MQELRDVLAEDLEIFFDHQMDPLANQMAAFPARTKEVFLNHWRMKILGNETAFRKTILVDGAVAGHILCWEQEGKRLVGYWLGQKFWGRGIATTALLEFLNVMSERPLFAYVAGQNVGSIRVLEKCGFTLYEKGKIFSSVHGREIEEFLMVLG